jgi:hypothetical protein
MRIRRPFSERIVLHCALKMVMFVEVSSELRSISLNNGCAYYVLEKKSYIIETKSDYREQCSYSLFRREESGNDKLFT